MVKNFNAMKAVVLKVDIPQVHTELADLISKFEAMQILGYKMTDYEKFFFKEELVAIAFWYFDKSQKAQNTEGSITNNDLFTDFETIN